MKCPKCQFENPEGLKYCNQCGNKLEITCPKCGNMNAPDSKFCGECGGAIEPDAKSPSGTPEHDPLPSPQPKATSLDGERKHATILFSDLSGYTAMSEKLDPEKVKDIMGRIFSEAGNIADKYDATVEKFFGDEIMILLGVPKAHEDDPVRAINVAMEIHELVEEISPEFEEETGVTLCMHTGINTGLVVTGDKYIGKSRHGLTGDTINLAKRLNTLAESGEIVVGPDTYYQSSGYFDFEDLKPTEVKGKTEPVQVYRVISPKTQPRKIHRLQGIQAKLIGRNVEMVQLREAAKRLREGQGAVFSIVGTAGTGKSRLIEEFKEGMDLEEIQWREGHAYPYTQNIPYFPLINLLSQAFGIKEGDSPTKMKEKIETGLSYLMGEDEEATPYIGSLFSLSYPGIDEVSPEFWKSKLQQSIQSILFALAQKGPTIICLEDLHWADPSFLELVRMLLSDFRKPILFLCIYRPVVSVFTSNEINAMTNHYQETRLQDLSPSESQQMVESLLKTQTIPPDLQSFIHGKVEGNPFYIEEVINSLIDSKTLVPDNGGWKTTRPIDESDISPTIHGIISSRLDRLEKNTKRVIQEASVIGRAFLYEILKRVTEIREQIDMHLSSLERLDLVKARTIQPDLEYIFKHALTQEVVYNGLLIKERKMIHERIGLVMEKLFNDRLPEFYEALSFHFGQSESLYKAVDYLIKSGEKSLSRYAVQESHQYYDKAYKLITDKHTKTDKERELLFDLLIKWSLVYYYRGDFKEQTALLKQHENEADLVKDKEKRGMFYGWLGFVLQFRWELADSYRYLQKALKLGEEAKSKRVVGYACTWLIYACAAMDKYEEGKSYWERAVSIAKEIDSDAYLYFKSMSGIAHLNSFSGEKKQSYEIGNQLLEYGMKHSNIRAQVVGHVCMGHSYFSEGNLTKAISFYRKAIDVAEDPFYTHWPRLYLGVCCVLNGQMKEGEEASSEVSSYVHKFGCELFGPFTMICLGIILIQKGDMLKGLKKVEELYGISKEKKWGYSIALSEFVLGNLYYQIAYGEKPSMSIALKNIGFLAKNVPFASKKAEDYFKNAIETAQRFKTKGIKGMASLSLGVLYKEKNKKDLAGHYLFEAIHIFEELGTEFHLKHARDELESL